MNLLDAVLNEPAVPDSTRKFFIGMMTNPTKEIPTGTLVCALSLLTNICFAEGQVYDDVPDRLGLLVTELNKRIPVAQ